MTRVRRPPQILTTKRQHHSHRGSFSVCAWARLRVCVVQNAFGCDPRLSPLVWRGFVNLKSYWLPLWLRLVSQIHIWDCACINAAQRHPQSGLLMASTRLGHLPILLQPLLWVAFIWGAQGIPNGICSSWEIKILRLTLFISCLLVKNIQVVKPTQVNDAEKNKYDSVADVPESWVLLRADFQSGSRVLKKVFWTFSYLYLWHTMWFHA